MATAATTAAATATTAAAEATTTAATTATTTAATTATTATTAATTTVTAAAAPVQEPPDTECTVCHEQFTVPKILPCGHLLCRHCLISWLQTEVDASCPLCRSPILDGQVASGQVACGKVASGQLASGQLACGQVACGQVTSGQVASGQLACGQLACGQSLGDVADAFPTHSVIAAIVEADRLLSKPHVCCVCDNVAAVSLCVNCGDMFCQGCTALHKKQSVSKHHQVETLTSLTADTLAAQRPTTCSVHSGDLAQLFCSTHNVAVCVVCATTDHHQCPHMVKTENRVQEVRAVLTDVAATLKGAEQKLERAMEEVEEAIQSLCRQTDTGIAEIKAVQQRLEKAVEACCRRLMEKVLQKSSGIQTPLLDGKAELKKGRARVVTHSRIVDQMQGFSMSGDVSDMAEKMKALVDAPDCSADVMALVSSIQGLAVSVDLRAVERMEQELAQLEIVKLELPVIRFHHNHGKRIRLSNDGQTAERTNTGWGDGMVISREPMIVDRLYQVKIDAINSEYSSTYLGVVTCSPDTLHIPQRAILSDSRSILCVRESSCRAFGQQLKQTWPALEEIAEGTRVGLTLDSSRSLHLYVNGQHQGVVTSDIPQPCYFMVDLFSRCAKVTALPVQSVEDPDSSRRQSLK